MKEKSTRLTGSADYWLSNIIVQCKNQLNRVEVNMTPKIKNLIWEQCKPQNSNAQQYMLDCVDKNIRLSVTRSSVINAACDYVQGKAKKVNGTDNFTIAQWEKFEKEMEKVEKELVQKNNKIKTSVFYLKISNESYLWVEKVRESLKGRRVPHFGYIIKVIIYIYCKDHKISLQ